jgi:hypothetical protein
LLYHQARYGASGGEFRAGSGCCRIAGTSVLAWQGLETSPPKPPVCNRPVKMNTIEEIKDVE